MSEPREGGDGVRITQREVYDELRAVSGKVDLVLELLPRESARIDTLTARTTKLELDAAAVSSLPAIVAAQGATLATLEGRLNKQSWLPPLVTAIVTAVAVAAVLGIFAPFLPQ